MPINSPELQGVNWGNAMAPSTLGLSQHGILAPPIDILRLQDRQDSLFSPVGSSSYQQQQLQPVIMNKTPDQILKKQHFQTLEEEELFEKEQLATKLMNDSYVLNRKENFDMSQLMLSKIDDPLSQLEEEDLE
ncbi:MAG: hypothetical protein EZS28_040697 [Streblomastix strix]|uniref:Uncharacterized protein n=1 Tax=Streblomastix strix TaxID=222440 RepID=A0A5J4TZ76_9EUKA|nr:MAG: hypothetical protein EZS28_040697 [Streblomastix strix]